MSAHRYWRLYVDTVNSSPYVSILELQLRTSIGGSSVATGGTASASSTDFGWVASGAFNGSTAEPGWHSGFSYPSTPQWLKYDFGSGNDKDIVEMAVAARPSDPDQNPVRFRLQYSDDDSSWTDLITVEGAAFAVSGAYNVYSADWRPDMPGVDGRGWRLRSTAVNGGSVMGIGELLMYVAGSSTNQCTGGTPHGSTWQENPPERAFDGVLTTIALDDFYWASRAVASWIAYNFSSAKVITTIGIQARVGTPANQVPKDFVLEKWDGSSWTTIFTQTSITGWSSGQLRYFDSTGEVAGPPSGSVARTSDFFAFI